MRHILISTNTGTPTAYTAFQELVNNPVPDQPSQGDQVGFYKLHRMSLRLTRNWQDPHDSNQLVVTHYHADPIAKDIVPDTHQVLDTDLMCDAINRGYEFVAYGVITPTHYIADYGSIKEAVYIARHSRSDKLVNLKTGQYLRPDDAKVTFFTCYCVMTNISASLPVYCLLLDPSTIQLTGGLDYYHTPSQTKFTVVDERQPSIKQAVLAPMVVGASTFGQNIIVLREDQTSFELSMFGPLSVIHDDDHNWTGLAGVDVKVTPGVEYEISPTCIKVTVPTRRWYKTNRIHTIKVSMNETKWASKLPDGGLTLEYVILQ